MGKRQHVVPHERGWAVKGELNEKATVVFDTRAEAVKRSLEIADNQKSNVIVHDQDGKIEAWY